MRYAILAALCALPLLSGCGHSKLMAEKVEAAQAAAEDANSKIEELQTKVDDLEREVEELKEHAGDN